MIKMLTVNNSFSIYATAKFTDAAVIITYKGNLGKAQFLPGLEVIQLFSCSTQLSMKFKFLHKY